ncbi:MAG: glycosyltransferase family 2 protein [Candidatus Sumerlaeaceae bacterium]|nr:glycosyltransferase family 2 protein [Candidatus Sumerlaeaceae bacterium]
MEAFEVDLHFSILMATYNRATLLPRAIDSVLRQTYWKWELIIVDDGSSDSTQDVLTHYAAQDSRIMIHTQGNKGLALARNRAARSARGDWLTFLDSDDEYRPTHLSLRAEFILAHPHVDFLHGGVEVVGEDQYVPDVHDPSRRIHLRECVIGGTFFLRKDAFIALGGFHQPDFGCDYDLFCRAKKILSIEKLEFPTYVYHRDVEKSMCKETGLTSRSGDQRGGKS